MEWSPTHITAVEVKLNPASVDIYGAIELDYATLCFPFPLVSTSSCSPESAMVPSSSKIPEVPLSLPLPPPLATPASLSVPPLLVPVRSSIHPSAPLSCMDAHASFQSPASVWQEDPQALWQSSEPLNPPRPSDPSASPWLYAPSAPPRFISPRTPPGSLVPPAPPWSGVDPTTPRSSTALAAPHPSIPLAPSDFIFPPALPWSVLSPAPPQPAKPSFPPRSCEPAVPPWPSRSLVSFRVSILPIPPGYPSLSPESVIPMMALRTSTPWLLPPSTQPWASFLAGLWVPIWLLPPSSPPWFLPAKSRLFTASKVVSLLSV